MRLDREDVKDMESDSMMTSENHLSSDTEGQNQHTRRQFVKRIGTLNKIARK
jgi:hypothetical protein